MSLTDQRLAFSVFCANYTGAASLAMADVLLALTDMHSLAYLRNAALAVSGTAAFILTLHEKGFGSASGGNNKAGRGTGSRLHATVITEMKALDGAANLAIVDVRGRIKRLKEQLAEPGWLDRMLDWTFGIKEGQAQGQAQNPDDTKELVAAVGEMVGGRAGAEEWAGKVLESWREGVKGWGMVRMEL